MVSAALQEKNIRLDDGLFEVTMIKTPRNAIELQEIITSLLRGEMDSNYIISYKTRQVVIRSEIAIPWTLDGEYGGDHKEVEICCHQKAVDIIVNHQFGESEI